MCASWHKFFKKFKFEGSARVFEALNSMTNSQIEVHGWKKRKCQKADGPVIFKVLVGQNLEESPLSIEL